MQVAVAYQTTVPDRSWKLKYEFRTTICVAKQSLDSITTLSAASQFAVGTLVYSSINKR